MSNKRSKIRMLLTYLIFFLFIAHEPAIAKKTNAAVDCGCTVTLSKNAGGGIYFDGSAIKPGAKVCIAAGTYTCINLSNFNGTAAAPIQIINCGGQVNITGYTYGFSLTKSRYFTFTGTGASGVNYGFKSSGGASYSSIGMGVSSCTDFTIDHIDISKTGVGVICKTNPTCDPATWEAAFTMRNVVFNNIYVHDTQAEGFYVGHTSVSVPITCNGKVVNAVPQKIKGLKIYNCLVESTGWDGIQISSAPENAQVYGNTVKNYGIANHSSQQAGILFGGISNGKVYNNYVANGTGNAMQVFGVGYIQVYNNVLVGAGTNTTSTTTDGMFLDDRPVAGYPAPYYTVCNNTVVSSKRGGVRVENSHRTIATMSEFHNNLVVASAEVNPDFKSVVFRNNPPNHSTGNVYLATISSAKFVSTTDYHLTASSPAINAGVAVSSWGIVTDKDGTARLSGTKPDAGAFEYKGTTSVANFLQNSISSTDQITSRLSPITSFRLFPNPVSTSLTVQVYSGAVGLIKVKLADISGKIVKEMKLRANSGLSQIHLALKELTAGLYSVHIQLGSWEGSQTIVKQ